MGGPSVGGSSAQMETGTSASLNTFSTIAWNRNLQRAAKDASRSEVDVGSLDSHNVVTTDLDQQMASHVLSKALAAAAEGEMCAEIDLRLWVRQCSSAGVDACGRLQTGLGVKSLKALWSLCNVVQFSYGIHLQGSL
jgi:hypothetical protein